jgi:ABC-type phosphate/phosphonate transport system ATPase subunit
MIELLGVGAPRADGGWLLHRVCARFRRGQITVVVSRNPDERRALLDAVTARIVPNEGRVWVNGVPVTRDTVGRIRDLVAEADLDLRPVERRSFLWNVLTGRAGSRALWRGLLRLPRKSERRSALRALERVGLGGRATEPARELGPADRTRLALACGLWRSPEFLVVREVDAAAARVEGDTVRATLRALAHRDRLAVLIGAADPSAAHGFADRLVVIDEGLLRYDGRPADFPGDRVA